MNHYLPLPLAQAPQQATIATAAHHFSSASILLPLVFVLFHCGQMVVVVARYGELPLDSAMKDFDGLFRLC